MVQQLPVASTQLPVAAGLLGTAYWILGTDYCYADRQMWGVSRWAARFLLVVMLVPAFGPMAMACAVLPQARHCVRQSVSAPAAQPAMHCHHAMAQSKATQPESSLVESSDASFHAANDDDCCGRHCCCGASTSEWAQPASNLLAFLNLIVEPAQAAPSTTPQSTDLSGLDSARAPPRS